MIDRPDPVTSLEDYLRCVRQITQAWYPAQRAEPWFRGTSESLVPGAIWAQLDYELGAYLEFNARAGDVVHREPADEWEWYFLMQHYGMATRLLDWTTNPLVAFYFALKEAIKAPVSSTKTPSIWMICPQKMNLRSVGIEWVFVPGGELTKHWLPSSMNADRQQSFSFEDRSNVTNEAPLAIYPKRRNPRILAQAGTFTIHGTKTDSIDQFMLELPDHLRKISQIRLKVTPDHARELLRQLAVIGISTPTLFPEPESLARDIREKYCRY